MSDENNYAIWDFLKKLSQKKSKNYFLNSQVFHSKLSREEIQTLWGMIKMLQNPKKR